MPLLATVGVVALVFRAFRGKGRLQWSCAGGHGMSSPGLPQAPHACEELLRLLGGALVGRLLCVSDA